MTTKTSFFSGDSYCAAWLTLPEVSDIHSKKGDRFPAIILVHGGGATHDMMLEQYERKFSEAGVAVLSFDFRHLGDSGGTPRQLLSIPRYLEDIDSAIRFLKSHPKIDSSQIALWGTSFGASHVIVSAARHPEIAATIVQCPVLKGSSPALKSGFRNLLRLTFPILSDLLRSFLKLPRLYVPMVGRPGELAFVTVPGALEGWHSVMPERYHFDNRVTAGSGIWVLLYNASRSAKKIQCPLLVCVSDHETLMDPSIAVKVGKDAKRGKVIHYPADHFEVYHPPVFPKMIQDQISFLKEHLRTNVI
ncbi:alpha/beta hydrolase [Leptospira perolatii]|uniref:Alpha/beta hydrolase n=1 Tax=Leptospira perolatii TaxID=2023191 RepID=A0A2M9ZKG8_9LEPT|nr:alpha/beta hydrolase [Leptospira perolatii]PJZ69414.1 alpha/beta hydrolase [Leptospira perolatii]PJZ72549.1 alpha/beta hydrolase [Leptospira perolatii]